MKLWIKSCSDNTKQILIDSAKRRFDVDGLAEIARIKEDMHIEKHGYPAFWALIRPGFNKDKINPDIICPMNYLAEFHPKKGHKVMNVIPIEEFLLDMPETMDIKLCKDVESLINKYNIALYSRVTESTNYGSNDYYYLLTVFDELIHDIQSMNLGEKYIGLFIWLLTKILSKDVEQEIDSTKFKNQLQTNRTVVFKTLYHVNKDVFLKCFSKNMGKVI